MTMREFIKANREELDRKIHNAPGCANLQLNDKDRAEWINNDEYLYRWARSEGVRI